MVVIFFLFEDGCIVTIEDFVFLSKAIIYPIDGSFNVVIDKQIYIKLIKISGSSSSWFFLILSKFLPILLNIFISTFASSNKLEI